MRFVMRVQCASGAEYVLECDDATPGTVVDCSKSAPYPPAARAAGPVLHAGDGPAADSRRLPGALR